MEVTSNPRPGFEMKIARHGSRKATKLTLKLNTPSNGAIDLNGREAREIYEALRFFYALTANQDNKTKKYTGSKTYQK